MTLLEYARAENLKLPQLAERLGWREHYVRKLMYGQRQPSLSRALVIEQVTGGRVTSQELLLKREPGQ